MRLLNKEWLRNMIDATGINFQFKYGKEFKPIFDMLYSKLENCSQEVLEKKFEELWKTTSYDWNNEYGFRGYPSLGQWLEILAEKPLKDQELEKRKIEYERNLSLQASIVGTWCNDPNLLISFPQRYKSHLNSHIKLMIDTYLNVKEELPDERIKKMATHLKSKLDDDKALFYNSLKGIARKQQPLLLT